MKQVKITAVKKVEHQDLMKLYENPITDACSVETGQSWISSGSKPEGFCESAWSNLMPYVLALSSGATGLFDGWMKNPASAMISCNDGFRPVSFYLEVLDSERNK